MPFIKAKTSCPISKKQETEIKVKIGKAIEYVPGKSEEYLLLEFEDNCRLWLQGDNTEPIGYIEAAVFGNEPHDGYDAFTAEITSIFADVLRIHPDHIYINMPPCVLTSNPCLVHAIILQKSYDFLCFYCKTHTTYA